MIKIDNNYSIGRKIREFRHHCGFTQEELAFRADISSVYLRQIEKDISNPTVSTVLKLCKALSIQPSELFELEKPLPLSSTEEQIIAFLSDKTENEKRIALEILKTAFQLKS